MAKSIVQEFTKGLWEQIPPFRLVLGICPALGVSTSVENALGMGMAVTFVLAGSNILISLLRNVIPAKVRIAAFIIIIATFVIIVEHLMQAYTYELFLTLGVFIPLIVVNCIPLGRAEAFASKNGILPSAADGLGLGVGYTLSLCALGALREILGNGTLTIWGDLGYNLTSVFPSFQPFAFMLQAPGAFIGLGLMLCVINAISK